MMTRHNSTHFILSVIHSKIFSLLYAINRYVIEITQQAFGTTPRPKKLAVIMANLAPDIKWPVNGLHCQSSTHLRMKVTKWWEATTRLFSLRTSRFVLYLLIYSSYYHDSFKIMKPTLNLSPGLSKSFLRLQPSMLSSHCLRPGIGPQRLHQSEISQGSSQW